MPVQRDFLSSILEWDPRLPLSVMGATGSGKTSLVLNHLRQHPELQRSTLIVSVDAVSLYRGLDIGSAKVRGADRSDFNWAGLDLFEVSHKVSLADYVNAVAPQILNHIENRRPVIMVGGSHFYERALVQGQSPGAVSDPGYQKSLEGQSQKELHQKLLRLDPRWAQKVHENDRYRLTRYLDLAERQGHGYDELFAEPKRHPALDKLGSRVQCMALGLDEESEAFQAKLRRRIQEMFDAGWVEEVRKLLQVYSPEAPGLQSLGYPEVTKYLAGIYRLAECQEQILIGHRQLAKKQRTWLRGLTGPAALNE